MDDKHATMLQRELFVPLEVSSVLEKVFMIIGGSLIVLVMVIIIINKKKTESGVGVVCDQVWGGCLCDQVRGGCCVWSGLGWVLCVIMSGVGVVCDQVWGGCCV